MNKNITLLMAALGLALSAQADVLTADQALQRVSPAQMRVAGMGGQTSRPTLLFTSTVADEPACYVFAPATGEGYMLVSADDVAAPLLGYSETGIFDADNMPPNLREWLEFYGREIEYARSTGAAPYEAPSRAAHQDIAPMCSTKWDQGAPFNNDCPMSNGRHTVTGCVATAVAQIMKYFNYPAKGQGVVNYTTTTLKYSLTLDYNDMPFDWANMLDTYPYASYGTETERAAVAQLMYGVGVAVRMDYGLDESSASTQSVPNAMINTFGYDKGMYIAYRDLYQKAEWDDMVYGNLRDYGPILYRGNDGSNIGHAFVCDGYVNGFYHFNWGWNGNSDGYYLLSALDPMSQGIGGGTPGGIGFVYGQGAILGICPPRADSQYYYSIYLDNGYTLPNKACSLGSVAAVKCTYYNGSNTTIKSGTLGLEFTNESGTSYYAQGTKLSNLAPNYGFSNYEVTLPTSLPSGKYIVRPAWVNSDYVRRPILVKYNEVQTYTAEVSGSKVTFTPNAIDTPAVTLDGVSVEGETYADRYITTILTLSNHTNVEFFNTIRGGLYALDAKDGSTPLYAGKEIMVDVGVGETCQYEYHTTYSGSKPGTYLFVAYDPRNRKWLGTPVQITLAEAPADVIKVTGLQQADGRLTVPKNGDITLEFDVTCESGSFENYLYVSLVRNNESYWRKYYTSPYIKLTPGVTEHCMINVQMPSTLSVGNTATFQVQTTSKKNTAKALSEPLVLTVVDPAGIADVSTDKTIVKSTLYNLQGIEMPADTTIPGHYILVTLYADGSTVTTHILK